MFDFVDRIGQSYTHPNYTDSFLFILKTKERRDTPRGTRRSFIVDQPLPMHDIGLIKLSQPIRSGDRGQGFAIENSICLPPEDYREDIGSYALTAGYGDMGPTDDRVYPLQMTYRMRSNFTSIKPINDFVSVEGGAIACGVSQRNYMLISFDS